MKNKEILTLGLIGGGLTALVLLKPRYKVGDVLLIYISGEGWSVFTILNETADSYLLGEGYPGNIIDQNWVTKAEFATYQVKKV